MRSASAKSFARAGDGSAAVEFAFIAPILLTCIVGILMLGMAYYDGASIQWSLERNMRAVMIDPDVTAAEIEAAIVEDLESIGAPDIELHYGIETSGGIEIAVARVDYEAPLHIPFLPHLSLKFSAENVAPAN